MTRMRLGISAGIIALIIFVAFALSVPHTRDVAVKKAPAETLTTPTVALRDVFKKGTHTISGSVTAVNACTPVDASVSLGGDASSTQSILVALTLETEPGLCLQVPTSVSFQVTIAAPANLPLEATVNGASASTTKL